MKPRHAAALAFCGLVFDQSRHKITVPKIDDFYSVNEVNKPPRNRVYHNNRECHSGRDIPEHDRLFGKPTGYRLCNHCIRLNRQGR
jgi:hypothetical protein